MLKLLKRFRRTPAATTPAKCHILEAPAEIRLAIYGQIVPGGFLPYAHHRNYMGLFLSCRQICAEMKHEAIRAAPAILDKYQSNEEETLMALRPLRPLEFSSLMHVTISVPRWALFSLTAQEKIFTAMAPLLELHLSSLTIGLDDVNLLGAHKLIHELTMPEGRVFREHWVAVNSPGQRTPPPADYYNLRTTYADIVEFATRINCLLAPDLCDGRHPRINLHCLRRWGSSPVPKITCNVRKIVFRLKKLHEEVRCHCGELPHSAYPFNSFSNRWEVTDEWRLLWRTGWWVGWMNVSGKLRNFSSKDPAVIIWLKLDKKNRRIRKDVRLKQC